MKKSKVIRLNEIQIKVLKQYLSDCSYYVQHDHYAFLQGERKTTNEIIFSILNDIIQKLDE